MNQLSSVVVAKRRRVANAMATRPRTIVTRLVILSTPKNESWRFSERIRPWADNPRGS
jgi:hypothetical protein